MKKTCRVIEPQNQREADPRILFLLFIGFIAISIGVELQKDKAFQDLRLGCFWEQQAEENPVDLQKKKMGGGVVL